MTPKESTTARGRNGEHRAAQFLRQHGYTILAQNFRSRTGEVDIIAGTEFVTAFVEVKSWRTVPMDALEYSIGGAKRNRLVQTARYFLREFPEYRERTLRFDVIFVSTGDGTIRHFEGAFEASCPE